LSLALTHPSTHPQGVPPQSWLLEEEDSRNPGERVAEATQNAVEH